MEQKDIEIGFNKETIRFLEKIEYADHFLSKDRNVCPPANKIESVSDKYVMITSGPFYIMLEKNTFDSALEEYIKESYLK